MGSCCSGEDSVEMVEAATVLTPFTVTEQNAAQIATEMAIEAREETQFAETVKQLLVSNDHLAVARVNEEFIKETGCSIKEEFESAEGKATLHEQKEEVEIVTTLLSDDIQLLLQQVARISELNPPELWFVMGLIFGLKQAELAELGFEMEEEYQKSLLESVDDQMDHSPLEQTIMRKYLAFRYVRLDSDEEVVSNLVSYCASENFRVDKFIYLLVELRDRKECHSSFENRFMVVLRQDFYTFLRCKFSVEDATVVKLLFDIITDREKALLDMICSMLSLSPTGSLESEPSDGHIGFEFDLQMLLAYTHLFRFSIDIRHNFPQFQDLLLQHIKGANYRYILTLWGVE